MKKTYAECMHRASTGPQAGSATFSTPCAQCDALIETDEWTGGTQSALRIMERLTRQRDDAMAVVDAAINALPDGLDDDGGLVSGVAEAARQLGVARRERDEARAHCESHDRRVRAEALREAADAAGKRHFSMGGLAGAEQWLRARADEIEGGER